MNSKFTAVMCCLVLSGSFASAQELGFDLPAPKPMINIGGLYFHGPDSSIEKGEFTNTPEADLRIKEIRNLEGRTFISGTALKGHIVYVHGPARIKGDKGTLRVLTNELAIYQFEEGENFVLDMAGEHEWFLWSALPEQQQVETAKQLLPADDGGDAPLFNPAHRDQLPSAVLPRQNADTMRVPNGPVPFSFEPVPAPQGPVWFEGTIEPLPQNEQPKLEKPKRIIIDGPVAEESSPVRK
jgi:hypothetical protein